MSTVLGTGVIMAIVLSAAQYTGNSMLSDTSDPEKDRFQNKTEIRNRFRRPVNELINEIGEGRGMLVQSTRESIVRPDHESRNIRAWLRRETEAEDQEELWHRCP